MPARCTTDDDSTAFDRPAQVMRLAAASLALLSTLALVPEAAAEPLYRCGAPADPHQPWRGFDRHVLVDAYGQEYGTVGLRDNEQALGLEVTLDDGWELQDSQPELSLAATGPCGRGAAILPLKCALDDGLAQASSRGFASSRCVARPRPTTAVATR